MAVSTVHASHATCTKLSNEGDSQRELYAHVTMKTCDISKRLFNNYVRSLCSAYFCGWFFLHWVSTYQQLLSTYLKLQSELSESLSTFHLPAAARYCHSRQWWETRRLRSCFHPKGTKSLNHRCQYKVQILAKKPTQNWSFRNSLGAVFEQTKHWVTNHVFTFNAVQCFSRSPTAHPAAN